MYLLQESDFLSMKPRAQSKGKTGKQEQLDGENEPGSSADLDANIPLRRSSRIQTIIKNAIAANPSRKIREKTSTKRTAEGDTGCEPKKKIARDGSSQSKKSVSRSNLVKKRSSRKSRKKVNYKYLRVFDYCYPVTYACYSVISFQTDDMEGSIIQQDLENKECYIDQVPTEVIIIKIHVLNQII